MTIKLSDWIKMREDDLARGAARDDMPTNVASHLDAAGRHLVEARRVMIEEEEKQAPKS